MPGASGEGVWIAIASLTLSVSRYGDDPRRPTPPLLAGGAAPFPGLTSDFACMTRAALTLSEATGERRYLDQALAWQAALDRHYANADTGGYFLTADDAEAGGAPRRDHDDASPTRTAIAAQEPCPARGLHRRPRLARTGRPLIEGVLGSWRTPVRAYRGAGCDRPAAARERSW